MYRVWVAFESREGSMRELLSQASVFKRRTVVSRDDRISASFMSDRKEKQKLIFLHLINTIHWNTMQLSCDHRLVVTGTFKEIHSLCKASVKGSAVSAVWRRVKVRNIYGGNQCQRRRVWVWERSLHLTFYPPNHSNPNKQILNPYIWSSSWGQVRRMQMSHFDDKLFILNFRGLKHESFCQTAEVEWVWWPNNKITKEEAATTPTAMLYNCSMANWPQGVGCSDVHQGAAWCLRGSAQICQQQLHHPLYIDRALSSVICSVFSVWSGNISNKNISGCCIITSACSTHCFSYLLWV